MTAESCLPVDCVVGLVSPGELGTTLAQALGQNGVRVITSAAGRSAATLRRVRQAELEIVPRLDDVGKNCDVLLCTVAPAAAREVAAEIRGSYRPTWRMRTYVDANSIAPSTMQEIVREFADTDVSVVDAAIHGQAAHLQNHATMYLSGADAAATAELFHSIIRVQVLGDQPGQASLMKMLLGGMTKGLVALFLQADCLAAAHESAAEFTDELRHFYPEMSRFLERSLPTYALHAERRGEEMGELARTLEQAGMNGMLARDVQRLFCDFSEYRLGIVDTPLTEVVATA